MLGRRCLADAVVAACACLLGVAAELQLMEENLKNLLSDAEWQSIMGNGDTDAHYAITHPTARVPDGEGALAAASRHLEIDAPRMGRGFTLRLLPSPSLLADDFRYLESMANGTERLIKHQEGNLGCFYRSERAALDLCEGVRGLVHTDDKHFFVIHPLPKRFHNDTSRPHVLVRKSHRDAGHRPHDCPHSALEGLSRTLPKKSTTSTAPNATKEARKGSLLEERRRSKRAAENPVFVETAVFVDRDLFDHMKSMFTGDTERELIRFVLAMINAVQLLYHDPSLGRPVNFVLKRLEVLKEEAAGLSRPPDIDKFLSNFCSWQRTKNPAGDREPQHWDHALILTGLDLYVRGKHGKISSQVVGLAPVAGMCTATSSCTVNEGRHFESVYVVAHEIGHNLGMRHDGPLAENECDPTSYLMSPTLGSGKITWSPCSRRYLQKFLETTQSRCLLDHGSSAGQLDHSAEGALPGERFGADQQCMFKYGSGSRRSSQQPLDDVCRDLHCERERYTWTSHPALEGTVCGHNMWCRGGRCVSRGLSLTSGYSAAKSTALRVEKIDGGWTSWKQSADCASGCLFGEEGRLRYGSTGIMVATRTCSNPRPQGGGAKCEGFDRKYQACTAQQCFNVPRITVREFAEQYCTRAKEVDKDLTGTGLQKISSDPVEACVVWCQKKNGSSKSRGWTFPDGTVCQTRRSRFGKPTYCINGRCEEFTCDQYDESQFTQLPELCPSDREDNEISWRSNTRRRDANTQWKSASGCHFNCVSPGSGVRLVVSKLKQGRSSIQLCQPDQYGCGRIKSPFQHATAVCSKYKERVRRLSGLGMQISPALEDPDRPCKVACQDEKIAHRFYLVNGEEGWFPFGTDCSRGVSEKRAYCISGKCLEFGQDNTPLSESEITLPLLSRIRRSLHNNTTKVTAVLQQQDLDEIVSKLNATIFGKKQYPQPTQFDIDLNNPIHVNIDDEATETVAPYDHYNNHPEVVLNYS